MRHSSPVLVLALACALPAAVGLSTVPASSVRVAPVVTALPDRADARLGFTADRDELRTARVNRFVDDDDGEGGGVEIEALADEPPATYEVGPSSAPPPAVDARAAHTGEASGAEQTLTFVSTSGGDADGEVWVDPPDSEPPLRVTCANDSRESHPVLSPSGDAVAFASDRAGGWDVWVVQLGEAPASCTDDEPLPAVRITTDSADDTWPAWALEGEVLVFSSDRADPATPPGTVAAPALGDLYAVQVDLGSGGEVGLVQLTTGPSADTQPAVMPGTDTRGEAHVVFTTTRFRTDGSLATVTVPDLFAGGSDLPVVPLWTGPQGEAVPQQQSSEASWSVGARELLLTTTRDDPAGDVHVVRVAVLGGPETGPGPVRAQPGATTPVAAERGVAESHGAFLPGFPLEEPGDDVASDVAYTRRSHDADVEDVVGADGSDRRTVGRTSVTRDGAEVPLDDVGPAYSPDGAELVHAAGDLDPWAPSAPVDGYHLVRAAADGTGARPLDYDRLPGDVDLDPAWSPDGTRLAFVRHRPAPGGYLAARIWVVTLATGDTVQVGAHPEGDPVADVDPAWSPDGARLAYAKVTPRIDVGVRVAPPTSLVRAGGVATVEVTVTAAGATTPVEVHVDFGGLADARIATPPAECTPEPGGAVCRLTGPANGRVLPFYLTGTRPDTYPVTATVRGLGEDPDPSNDTAAAEVTVAGPPALAIDIETSTIESDETSRVVAQATVRTAPTWVEVRVPLPPTVVFVPEPGTTACRFDAARSAVVCEVPPGGFPGTVPVPVFSLGMDSEEVEENETLTLVMELVTSDGQRVTDSDDLTVTADPDPEPGPVINLAAARTATVHRVVPAAAVRAPVPGDGTRPVAVLASRVTTPLPSSPRVHVMDAADGSGDVALTQPAPCPTPAPEPCTAPLLGQGLAWSPDGAQLAVEHLGAVHLVTLADAGGDGPDVPEVVTTVAQLTGIRPDGTATPSRGQLSVTEDPAWSPDGAELAVTGQPAGHPDRRGIYALGLDGSVLRAVAQGPEPETQPAYQPFEDVVPPTADLSVDVTLDAAERWLGGEPVVATVVVRNGAPPGAPASGTVVTLAYPPFATVTPDPACPPPGTTCALGTLGPGDSRVLTATLAFPAPEPEVPETLEQPETPSTQTGQVRASVTSSTPDPVPANDTDAADLALQRPTLRLLPAVSKPGTVVLAYGENFPPGEAVELVWSQGITVDPGPAEVDSEGTVRFSVLVVRRDRLGARTLDATSPDGLFGLVRGDLLVVARSSSPPELIARG
ncbi:hypothetical protein [Cellulomonas sp. NS3]|uniref:hypothetical protein n=1 Tax=Cellulomonas sp. NS3 TaxID=2973977 RepID=UPI002162B394|nr:hypothetical protein [Cellulomonas sp. NS3]